MTAATARPLARFKRVQTEGPETLHWYWVLGSAGAVSTWLSDSAHHLIGKAVCSGACWHSARPVEGAEEVDPCEYLEGRCYMVGGSVLWLQDLAEAWRTDGDEPVYAWLARQYLAGPWAGGAEFAVPPGALAIRWEDGDGV